MKENNKIITFKSPNSDLSFFLSFIILFFGYLATLYSQSDFPLYFEILQGTVSTTSWEAIWHCNRPLLILSSFPFALSHLITSPFFLQYHIEGFHLIFNTLSPAHLFSFCCLSSSSFL